VSIVTFLSAPPVPRVTVVRLSGGLGNQMFQYALGRAISERAGTVLELDGESGFKGDHFGRDMSLARFSLKARPMSRGNAPLLRLAASHSRLLRLAGGSWLARMGGGPRIYHERALFGYDAGVFRVPAATYFSGYWQNPHYFESLAVKLRHELTLPELRSHGRLRTLMEELQSTNSVAVHIRRYDKSDLKLFGRLRSDQLTMDASYYRRALDLLGRRERDLRIFLFSDDSDAALPGDEARRVTRIDSRGIGDDAGEQALMAACKHQIIANSTYSWWAAWLNPNPAKTVVAPRRWFRSGLTNEGIFPANWTILG